jgi:predicted DNA-binding transcriptional regulator YafY
VNFIKQIERLILLNKLIIEQQTGTPEDLARRLNISPRQAYNMLEMIRDMGVDVRYSKKSQTYYYENCSGLRIQFSLKALNSEEEKTILGGGKKDCGLQFYFSLQA